MMIWQSITKIKTLGSHTGQKYKRHRKMKECNALSVKLTGTGTIEWREFIQSILASRPCYTI